MQVPSQPHFFDSQHTFGRAHFLPPPLPQSMLQSHSMPAHFAAQAAPHGTAGSLPHDFDHIVRSVGEW